MDKIPFGHVQQDNMNDDRDNSDLPGDMPTGPLDFNALLVENPVATFAVRIAGKSMTGAGMFPGDIAVVNRARAPKNGDIALAVVDREFTLNRYRNRGGRMTLQADNPRCPDIEITNGMVERFNGRIADVLKTNRFVSGEDFEKTIMRYVGLYNMQLPQ